MTFAPAMTRASVHRAADDETAGVGGDAAVRPPRNAVVAVSDPRTVALLREAVREVFPETRVQLAGAMVQARLLLATMRPDLVVIDLNMADAALRDFIVEAGRRNAQARVIVVAGHGDDDRILPALRAGATGFLLKYDPPAVIAEQMRETHAGGLPLSGSLARQLLRHLDRTGQGGDLTAPELEILTWLSTGDTLVEAAERMRIDRASARRLVGQIYRKLRLGDAEAAP